MSSSFRSSNTATVASALWRSHYKILNSAAAYADEQDEGHFDAYGVMVFAIQGDMIAGITGFPQPGLFEPLGLPIQLEGNA